MKVGGSCSNFQTLVEDYGCLRKPTEAYGSSGSPWALLEATGNLWNCVVGVNRWKCIVYICGSSWYILPNMVAECSVDGSIGSFDLHQQTVEIRIYVHYTSMEEVDRKSKVMCVVDATMEVPWEHTTLPAASSMVDTQVASMALSWHPWCFHTVLSWRGKVHEPLMKRPWKRH